MTRPRTEELVAAYLSGAADLTAEERAAVEALLDQSPAARTEAEAIGDVLGALRELPPEPPPASEAVVRSVRIACAEPPPAWPVRARAWLRARWPVALAATATAATAAFVAIQLGRDAPTAPPPPAPTTSTAVAPAPAPGPTDDVASADELWLDGEAVELRGLDDKQTDAIERELSAALDDVGLADQVDLDDDGLLPADDLGWVDDLDDDEIDALEVELDRQPV